MSVYVLDVPRFDKTQPGNVRPERYVVFGFVGTGDGVLASLVFNETGERVLLDHWMSAERFALYEEMRKADRNWRALTAALGRPDNAPGRVA